MSRLYLRIFLSFWLVIILTISAVLVINSQIEHAQLDDTEISERAQRMASGLSMRAQLALDRGGVEGLARWAEQGPQRGRRLVVYAFDQSGREVLERQPPRELRGIVRSWLRDETTPDPARRGQFITSIANPEHGRFLIVLNPPARPFVLRIFGPLGLAGLIGLAILFSGLICLWLARTISRPVQQLRLAGQALGRGELDTRTPALASRRGDELGELARDFDRMAERLQGLINAQRQLLRDVSHELRSPLARLQVSLALASDATDQEERHRYLDRTETEVERLNHLIGEILSYARITQNGESSLEPVNLVDLLEDIAESARLEGAPRDISVTVSAPESKFLVADGELLYRAIENVTRNALRHSPVGGTIEVSLEADPGEITITIRDQGPGVDEQHLDDMFKPFVRLSPERGEAGPGGGVGLAIARAAIERHGGTIVATNHSEGGLQVTIHLPVSK